MKETKKEGITLVALVITIIILLILAGIAIAGLGGENGLIAKVNKAKQAHIKAEIKEDLILAITELQTEKEGKATLDDITQEWANSALEGYNSTVTSDASISGKKITMKKSNVTEKYIIDENLNVIEIEENTSSIEFWYEAKERIDNKVKIIIHVQDEENGLNKIEFPDQDAIIITTNKKEENVIDYQVEIGKESKIKITSESGEEKEETIIIEDYWYKITKNLGEEIEIDNTAIKVEYNKQYQATLTTKNDYIIGSLTVTMGGQAVTTQGNNIVDKTTGKINIEKVTGDIEITATAKKYANINNGVYAYYPLTSNLNNDVEGSDINDITYSSGTVTFNSDRSVTKSGDSLKISNLTKLTDEFTVGIDFCYTSTPSSNYLFGICLTRSAISGMIGVSVIGNNAWQTWNGSSNERQYVNPEIEANKWYRLVMTGGNEKFSLYLNGNLIAERNGYNCLSGTFNILEGDYGESFDGKMKNLIFFNRCLSSEEVSILEFQN